MTDPRIIPDDQLANYEDYAERVKGYSVTAPIIKQLLEHIEALAEQVDQWKQAHDLLVRHDRAMSEQVDSLTHELAGAVRGWDNDRDLRDHWKACAEKAEADRDAHLDRAQAWKQSAESKRARADAADQRLANLTKVIREQAERAERLGMQTLAETLRALLDEGDRDD